MDLSPERNAKTASSYARQCIWDLRDKLGAAGGGGVVRFLEPHHRPHYRLGSAVQVEPEYQALLALSFELRQQMAVHRQAGDLRRVVMFANQLLKHDPLNCKVLQERVEAIRTCAPPSELAGYMGLNLAKGDILANSSWPANR